jgi:hypothetical protein
MSKAVFAAALAACVWIVQANGQPGPHRSAGPPDPGADLITLAVGDVSLTVDVNMGARIVSFKIGSQEVLSPNTVNRQFFGSSLWLSPEGKWNGHGVIDRAPYRMKGHEAMSLELHSQPDNRRGFLVTKYFQGLSQDTAIQIRYTIKNIADSVQEVAPWEVTRVPTGGLAFFPKRNPADDPQKNAVYPVPLIVDSSGLIWYPYDSSTEAPQKLFANGGEGWVAYARGGILFIKAFPLIDPSSAAPHEKNVELYVDKAKTYMELENQGRYQRLKPGEELTYSVKWYVRKLPPRIPVTVGNMALVNFVRAIVRNHPL